MDSAAELARDLRDEPVIAAYLFGSVDRGTAGALSDVDVALLPDPGLAREDRIPLAARVSLRAAAIFGRETCDVVLLDEAAPSIAFAAIQGTLLLDKDPDRRVVVEARIQSAYHDRVAREEWWNRETLARYARGDFA